MAKPPSPRGLPRLMVEQSHSCERHGHAVLVAAVDNHVVADRSAGLCDVGNAALLRTLDVIVEGEERIGAKGNARNCVKVSSLLLTCEGCGFGGKVLLPVAVCANVLFVLVDVAVDNVVAVGSAKLGLEGKVKHLVVLAEEPRVSLAACKSCAVNSRLLTCANAYSLSVYCEADRVGLCVLKCDKPITSL